MKLRSGLRPLDESFIIDQDNRIKSFRAKQWERLEGFEPFEMFLLCCIAAACAALGILMIATVIYIKWFAE